MGRPIAREKAMNIIQSIARLIGRKTTSAKTELPLEGSRAPEPPPVNPSRNPETRLGIRFDIARTDSGYYGGVCWRAFWKAVSIEWLRSSTLCHGDTNATLTGSENVYCIAIKWDLGAPHVDEVMAAMRASPEYQAIAATPAFVVGPTVDREPLPTETLVDAELNLTGESWHARNALQAVRDEAESKPFSRQVPEDEDSDTGDE